MEIMFRNKWDYRLHTVGHKKYVLEAGTMFLNTLSCNEDDVHRFVKRCCRAIAEGDKEKLFKKQRYVKDQIIWLKAYRQNTITVVNGSETSNHFFNTWFQKVVNALIGEFEAEKARLSVLIVTS